MFTWLNKQGVKSDKGFIVQVTGRFTIEYVEGTKKIVLYIEPGLLPGRKHCVIVDAKNFLQWDNGAPIPKEKQQEIIKNFIEAMEFQDMGVVLE